MEVAFQAEAEDSNMGMCLVRIKSGTEARVWGGGVGGGRVSATGESDVHDQCRSGRTWASTLKEMRGHQTHLSRERAACG